MKYHPHWYSCFWGTSGRWGSSPWHKLTWLSDRWAKHLHHYIVSKYSNCVWLQTNLDALRPRALINWSWNCLLPHQWWHKGRGSCDCSCEVCSWCVHCQGCWGFHKWRARPAALAAVFWSPPNESVGQTVSTSHTKFISKKFHKYILYDSEISSVSKRHLHLILNHNFVQTT